MSVLQTAMLQKQELLTDTIEHVDITQHNVVPLVDAMRQMAFSARDLARAAEIYERMLRDTECGVILCLAGSLISSGLKQVFVDLIRNRMVDCVVSTGANIVDQDFFEALGYKHYIAPERLKAGMDDDRLRELAIDRIYDTLIDEDQLRICDETVKQIADALPPRPYSSREFIEEMGRYLTEHAKCQDSIVLAAHEHGVPIFCPAFSDSSAGLGIVAHYAERGDAPKTSFDSAVADVRDGALSSSTLKEASSWGKVDTVYEQMVFSEATLAVPLIAGYAYHKQAMEGREFKRFADIYAKEAVS